MTNLHMCSCQGLMKISLRASNHHDLSVRRCPMEARTVHGVSSAAASFLIHCKCGYMCSLS